MKEYYCFNCRGYSYSAVEMGKSEKDVCPYCGSKEILYSLRELERMNKLERELSKGCEVEDE